MTNLLNETKKVLKEHNKTLKDVVAIQGNDFGITIDKFIALADTEYDAGYGSPKVAEDLLIIGKDWWLERREHNGCERWEYNELSNILPINDDVYALTVNQSNEDIYCGWETLSRINGIESKGWKNDKGINN